MCRRGDPIDSGAFGAGDEVRLGQVNPFQFVGRYGTEKEIRIHANAESKARRDRFVSAIWRRAHPSNHVQPQLVIPWFCAGRRLMGATRGMVAATLH